MNVVPSDSLHSSRSGSFRMYAELISLESLMSA
jgi:hypothetical protein